MNQKIDLFVYRSTQASHWREAMHDGAWRWFGAFDADDRETIDLVIRSAVIAVDAVDASETLRFVEISEREVGYEGKPV